MFRRSVVARGPSTSEQKAASSAPMCHARWWYVLSSTCISRRTKLIFYQWCREECFKADERHVYVCEGKFDGGKKLRSSMMYELDVLSGSQARNRFTQTSSPSLFPSHHYDCDRWNGDAQPPSTLGWTPHEFYISTSISKARLFTSVFCGRIHNMYSAPV